MERGEREREEGERESGPRREVINGGQTNARSGGGKKKTDQGKPEPAWFRGALLSHELGRSIGVSESHLLGNFCWKTLIGNFYCAKIQNILYINLVGRHFSDKRLKT